MKLKIATVHFLLFMVCLCMPCLLHAQPGFGDDVDDVPIDGGLSLLLTAGAGYGIKKMRKDRINQQIR